MKFKKTLLGVALLCSLSTLQASEKGEDLFNIKCMSCHIKTKPNNPSELVAPPLMGVMRHTKMQYSTKDDAVAFIIDYVLEPKKTKAVCMPHTIERFGLMPSQKGNVSKEELYHIASWMYDNFSPANFNGMRGGKQSCKSCNTKKCNSQSNYKKNKMAKQNNKKFSPFLINSKKMPHMTSLVKKNWDNQKFNLSKEQKKVLLEIKNKTMASVMDLSAKIKKLEQKVQKLTMSGEDKRKIYKLVDQIANLKAEATKTHVECIQSTLKVLNKTQVKLLLNK